MIPTPDGLPTCTAARSSATAPTGHVTCALPLTHPGDHEAVVMSSTGRAHVESWPKWWVQSPDAARPNIPPETGETR